MTAFTFYLLEDDDAVPAFEIAMFDAVDSALAHGRRLLKDRPRYSFVEITSEDASIAKLGRDSLA
jgi:hypothetical protein